MFLSVGRATRVKCNCSWPPGSCKMRFQTVQQKPVACPSAMMSFELFSETSADYNSGLSESGTNNDVLTEGVPLINSLQLDIS